MTVRAVSNNPGSPYYNASAPNLTGQAGQLAAVLDAVLVNGFSGFTALGWTIAYTTTNKRAYQQASGGNATTPMYMYLDDTGPGAGGAREARVCGFETMTAITPTGTGQFPSSAQSGIGVGTLVIRKSATADATARYWTIVGNGQTFYLWTETGDFPAPALAAFTFCFGDFKSYRTSGDPYAVHIIGRNIENSGQSTNEPFPNMAPGSSFNYGSRMWGHFLARSWTGLGGSLGYVKFMDWGMSGNLSVLGGYSTDTATSYGGSTSTMPGRFGTTSPIPAPNGPDGSIIVSPIRIAHSWGLRGYMPGLWVPMHNLAFTHNDQFTIASGNLTGKTMLNQNLLVYFTGNDYGNILAETSNTW